MRLYRSTFRCHPMLALTNASTDAEIYGKSGDAQKFYISHVDRIYCGCSAFAQRVAQLCFIAGELCAGRVFVAITLVDAAKSLCGQAQLLFGDLYRSDRLY